MFPDIAGRERPFAKAVGHVEDLMGANSSVLSVVTCIPGEKMRKAPEGDEDAMGLEVPMRQAEALHVGPDVPPSDRSGSQPAVAQLPIDISLRVSMALSSGIARLSDLCAFSGCCRELWRGLQGVEHPLWNHKLDSILGEGRWANGSPFAIETLIQPRQQCILLLIAARLLQSVLTSCDWLALFDCWAVLSAAGISSIGDLAVALHALLAWQDQSLTPQALHWLWNIAATGVEPWKGSSRPEPEVVRLDRLRCWLRDHVTPAIVPWHERGAFKVHGSYDGVFDWPAQELFARFIGRTAAMVLFAAECASPSRSPSGLGSVVSLEELLAAVETVLRQGDDHGLRLRAFALMLLARCAEQRQSEAASLSMPGAGAPKSRKRWEGHAVSWTPLAERPPPGGAGEVLESLRFSELRVEGEWLHTQHGELVETRTGARRTVQLDAKMEWPQVDCFMGYWMDQRSLQVLPARAFALDTRCGGLRRWVANKLRVPSCAEERVSKEETVVSVMEFFGIVGEPRGEILRCFHLRYCGEGSSGA